MSFSELDELLRKLTSERIIPAISVAVGRKGRIEFSSSYGRIYETDRPVNADTRFDIASMTKVFSGICFIRLIEQGLVKLEDPVCAIFPELSGMKPIVRDGMITGRCDGGRITWRHVLTHTTGMGRTGLQDRPSLPHLAEGLDDIFSLPFAYQTGERVVYTDFPIILMGKAMEMLTGSPLDRIVSDFITGPLGLTRTGYLRLSENPVRPDDNIAPTENDTVFRHRRLWGEVHDENAFLLDGVSAHAGLFSTAGDICALTLAFNGLLHHDGIISSAGANMMIREYANDEGDRKGLIWRLKYGDPDAYTRELSERAYGHDGFTGCFMWNDPESELSVAFLSNDVYSGRENRRLAGLRREIMHCIAGG